MCELGLSDFTATKVKENQYGALVAFPAEKKIHLCEFQVSDFQPELKTEHLWYVSAEWSAYSRSIFRTNAKNFLARWATYHISGWNICSGMGAPTGDRTKYWWH